MAIFIATSVRNKLIVIINTRRSRQRACILQLSLVQTTKRWPFWVNSTDNERREQRDWWSNDQHTLAAWPEGRVGAEAVGCFDLSAVSLVDHTLCRLMTSVAVTSPPTQWRHLAGVASSRTLPLTSAASIAHQLQASVINHAIHH